MVADVEVFLELADKKHSCGIRLQLLEGSGRTSESLFHSTFSVHGFLYAKSMGDLTEYDIPEERIRGYMLSGLSIQKAFGSRFDDIAVLGLNDVLKKDGTGAAIPLDIFIKGQVQGNDLDTCIRLTGIVQCVAGEDVRTGSGLESLVSRIAGKLFLQLADAGNILHQLIGLRLVLEQDISLI